MDRAREKLLAGSALALEQHRRVGRGDALGLGPDGPHTGGLSDDLRHLARRGLGEEQRFPSSGPPLDRAGDEQAQQVRDRPAS